MLLCWSTTTGPTTALTTKTTDGTGTGIFDSSITGLTAGTVYYVRAYAINSAGTAYGSELSFTTLATVPGAPTIGTASAGNAQATVAFTAPAINGGSAITGYTVTSNPGSETGTGAASPITVSGLTNGTAYTFTVTATNAIGNSVASSASNPVTPIVLSIGLDYQGEKIAYLLVSGDPGYDANVQHGLIAAVGDQSTSIAWITGVSTQTTANGNTLPTLGKGQANTNYMIAQTGYTGGAAKVCDDYSITVNSVTYSDWYLPSNGTRTLYFI